MFCRECGNELEEGARFCAKCGHQVDDGVQEGQVASSRPTTVQPGKYRTVVLIFMIISILASFPLEMYYTGDILAGVIAGAISLCWSLPMTIHVYNNYNSSHKIGTAFKVCVLLFVNFIAGILLLSDNQQDVA